MDLKELVTEPAYRLAGHLHAGEVTAQELVEALLVRIEAVEDEVKAYITVDRKGVLAQARQADERLQAGEAGPLTGVPVAVKDNMCTRGLTTTCGSRMLADFVPPYDATVVSRLRRGGLPIIGKTNMDEFAMGSSCENSAFDCTQNPRDTRTVPGGSSGGSAAAVSAATAPLALGSDTGGSIRQPAAFCGVVGMKPTYGLVSRFGLVAFASSLDQIGPFGQTVQDAALLLEVIAGHDPHDSTSVNRQVGAYGTQLEPDVDGLHIGVPQEYLAEGIDEGVQEQVVQAVAVLEDMGARVSPCSLPHTEYALPCYYIIAPAEASSNLARYDGVRYGLRVAADDFEEMFSQTRAAGFGPEVKRRIMLGTFALSSGYYDAYYLKAQQVRTLVKEDFEAAFATHDLLLTPTSPTPAFRLGARVQDPLQMYLSDQCTIPVNLAGLPALSLPYGDVDGLPVGIQLIAPPFQEQQLFNAAAAFEAQVGALGPVDHPGGER